MFEVLLWATIAYVGYYYVKSRNDITGKDFEAYKNRYPELVKNGKVYCCQCNSSSIALMRERSPSLLFKGILVHQCRSCGCKLYYSEM